MVESTWKKAESEVKKLTTQQCYMILDSLGIEMDDELDDAKLGLNVMHCILDGDIHPRDITDLVSNGKKVKFTIKTDVEVVLPAHLVCKKTGNMDNGKRFCEIGKTYELTEVQHNNNINLPVSFTVLTEYWTDDGCSYLTPHYMTYEFLKEYFHVTF